MRPIFSSFIFHYFGHDGGDELARDAKAAESYAGADEKRDINCHWPLILIIIFRNVFFFKTLGNNFTGRIGLSSIKEQKGERTLAYFATTYQTLITRVLN